MCCIRSSIECKNSTPYKDSMTKSSDPKSLRGVVSLSLKATLHLDLLQHLFWPLKKVTGKSVPLNENVGLCLSFDCRYIKFGLDSNSTVAELHAKRPFVPSAFDTLLSNAAQRDALCSFDQACFVSCCTWKKYEVKNLNRPTVPVKTACPTQNTKYIWCGLIYFIFYLL